MIAVQEEGLSPIKLHDVTGPRKRDGQQRRRELCDAAIEVLAAHGSHGLSHPRVDSQAQVPNGTTSYYYRTRAALLRAVAERVADIDTANLRSVIDSPGPGTPLGRIASLVMMQGEGPGLVLNKARHELLLTSTRDPTLAAVYQDFVPRIIAMSRDAIARILPGNDPVDPALLELQSAVITTFIEGVYGRLLVGDHTVGSADDLERILHTIAKAVGLEHTLSSRRRRRP